MLRYLLIGSIVIISLVFNISVYSQEEYRDLDSRDLSVLISVDVQIEPNPTITLTWDELDIADAYMVLRRTPSISEEWTTLTNIPLDGNTHEYIDENVEIGVEYEYLVYRVGIAISTFTVNNQQQKVPAQFLGTGYTFAGIKVNNLNERKIALLLIDETIQIPLEFEINRLINDLTNEGWYVIPKYVARAEEFEKDKVIETKEIITSTLTPYYNQIFNNGLRVNLFIFGRVAVPYSGAIAPDAHGDHYGAWPADVYYANLNGIWTDNVQNTNTANRPQNRNVPGDGKFDQNTALADIEWGRVDFYDMPLFYDETVENPEAELLRKYLDKNHLYRTNQIEYTRRGLIDDNFSAANIAEGFASSGYRNAGTLFGKDNVKKVDWFTNLQNESYMYAYGCGGGTYTSAGGVGNSNQFANLNVNAIFTMLFGSYFGDWDSQNNFMRAALASEPSILTCSWSARPHWFIHHTALGYNIGYSARLSHNNNNSYIPNGYRFNDSQQFQVANFSRQGVHNTLIGDPTLNMYMGLVPEVESLDITKNEAGYFELSWNKIPDCDDCLYVIYRATDTDPINVLASPEPLNTTIFEDIYSYNGEIYYSLAAVKLIESNAGSFYVAGPRVKGETQIMNVIGPVIASSRNELNFGIVETQTSMEFTLSNNGDQDLIINSITIINDNEGVYSIDSETGPFIIPIGSTDETKVKISFEPKEIKQYNSLLRLRSNATNEPIMDISLSGSGATSVDESGSVNIETLLSLSIVPNPVSNIANIRYEVLANEIINGNISIYDISGNLITYIHKDFILPGSYVYNFDANEFANGKYFIIANVNNKSVTLPFVIAK